MTDRDALVSVALGQRPADLIITGGQLVNVYSGEIYPADVAVEGNRIAAVGDVGYCIGPETIRVDAAGRYLVPGLIDCHIHVGATALVMTEFARLVVPHGTAAIVTDFTEAGKMRGLTAMRFFLDEAINTPLKVFLSPFYTTLLGIDGHASMTMAEMHEILTWPECVELREWNLFAQRHTVEALRPLADSARARNRLLCGHLEGQDGRTLQASISTGVLSDHEAGTAKEALERIRLGVAVQMRFASSADDMQHVLKAITQHRYETRFFMFSTDEEDIDDIGKYGHIDHRVRTAIRMGVPPLESIRMASLNAATYLGKTGDLGAIAPGRIAFINLVEDLAAFKISKVIYGGEVVAEYGDYIGTISKPEYPASFFNTIHLQSKLRAGDFRISSGPYTQKADVRAIKVKPRQVKTQEKILTLPVDDGEIKPSPDLDLAKISVIERHQGSGKMACAFLQGMGLKRGAFGISYHPGPLHIGVVGMNDEDMALVVNRIAELGGGFVAAQNGKILDEVALPILGFLSQQPAKEVLDAFAHLKAVIAHDLGVTMEGLYTTLAYIFMPGVIPKLRMTINGLVRVKRGQKDLSVMPVSLFSVPDEDAERAS